MRSRSGITTFTQTEIMSISEFLRTASITPFKAFAPNEPPSETFISLFLTVSEDVEGVVSILGGCEEEIQRGDYILRRFNEGPKTSGTVHVRDAG